jgi:demethylmenaquinone methyltransferase/2-methoxy-6-polyprenyl-1,4-benzoquinol methylase
MLSLAIRKTLNRGTGAMLGYIEGDAHALPFGDGQFICATVAFGVRNFVQPSRALREMARVVRPGGRVVVLEIVRQGSEGLVGRLMALGFRYVTPWLGAVFAGDREAYAYLPRSAQRFESSDELAESMREAGLANVTYRSLALGAVAIHVGEKESTGDRA